MRGMHTSSRPKHAGAVPAARNKASVPLSNRSRIYGGRPAARHPRRAQADVLPSTTWKRLDQGLLWQGEPADLLKPSAPAAAAVWKMFLLSDGSVTRHLQMLTGRPITVECLQTANIGADYSGLLFGPDLIPPDLVQRQVLLRCGPCPPAGPPPAAAPGQASTAGSSSSGSGSSSSSSSSSSSGTASSDVRNGRSSGGGGGGSDGQEGVVAEGVPLVYAASWWNAADINRYLKDAAKPIWVSLSEGQVELYREVQAVQLGACPDLQALLQCEGPLWGRHYVFWHGGRPLTLIYEVFSSRVPRLLGLPPNP